MAAFKGDYAAALTCFALSGAAALVFQTIWFQQFAVVFGTSDAALAAVLAAFMGSLALGAAVASRIVDRLTRPVRLYAALELLVGLFALLVSPLVLAAGWLQERLFVFTSLDGSSAAWVYQLIACGVILGLPATVMGATLPVLVRGFVLRREHLGTRIPGLYAVNAAGGALGTLVAAYLLLPRFGVGGAIYSAIGINLLVALVALGLDRKQSPVARRDRTETLETRRRGIELPLLLAGASGFVAFVWEVLWTRLLSHLVGGTIYAAAIMLATFLLGIAAGSLLAGRLSRHGLGGRTGFIWAQIFSAAGCFAAFSFADFLPGWMAEHAHSDSHIALASAAMIMPGAIASGFAFPCAIQWLSRSAEGAANASARIFAANTVGAIIGALVTGYLLLPALGFKNVAQLAVSISVLIGFVAAAAPWENRKIRPGLTAAAAALLLVFLVLPIGGVGKVLRVNPLTGNVRDGEIEYLAVGRSSTVLVTRTAGRFLLSNNGLPEAQIERKTGRPGSQPTARWLSLAGFAARPEADNILVIGLGGGTSVENIPDPISLIDVVELEPRVVEANAAIAEERLVDPLDDERLRLYVNDARAALRLSSQKYDIIVSQPSHPWTSAASHLFTSEFLDLVKRRLSPNGVFVQWMGISFVDEELLRSMLATAADRFGHVAVFAPHDAGLILVMSPGALDIADSSPRAFRADPAAWQLVGVINSVDVEAALTSGPGRVRSLAVGARVNSDKFNGFQMRGPRVLGRAITPREAREVLADPDLMGLYAERPFQLLRSWIRMGRLDTARTLARQLTGDEQRLAEVIIDRAQGRVAAAEFSLQDLLTSRPGWREAQSELFLLHRQNLGSDPNAIEVRLDEPSARVVFAAWRGEADCNWQAVAALDDQLARIATNHPLYLTALRLRAAWRVSGEFDETHALAAGKLLTILLQSERRSTDLLLAARAAAILGQGRHALVLLREASDSLGPVEARDAMELALTLSSREPGDRALQGRVVARLQQQLNSSGN